MTDDPRRLNSAMSLQTKFRIKGQDTTEKAVNGPEAEHIPRTQKQQRTKQSAWPNPTIDKTIDKVRKKSGTYITEKWLLFI